MFIQRYGENISVGISMSDQICINFVNCLKLPVKKKESNLAIFINEALDISNEMNMTFSKHYFILCTSF